MTRHPTTYVHFCLDANTYSSSHAVYTTVHIQSVRTRPPEHKQSEARMHEHRHEPCFADECKTCLNFQMSSLLKFKPPSGDFMESMAVREISLRLDSIYVFDCYIQPPGWC
uniref:Putative dual specificty phosphatase n=1 Tax=Ixodes ricinus TaxID=34613 RepID=A0A0K8RCD1_IXORI